MEVLSETKGNQSGGAIDGPEASLPLIASAEERQGEGRERMMISSYLCPLVYIHEGIDIGLGVN